MKSQIGIVCGGYSGEAVVSMKSAQMILDNIDRSKYDPYQIVIEKDEWYCLIGESKYPIDKNDFSFRKENEKIKPEICFVIVHGTPGEDGKLQGYFEMIGMPHTTGNLLNLSLTFNKRASNDVLTSRGFKTTRGTLLTSMEDFDLKEIESNMKLPLFVKPNEGGSSIGMSKVNQFDELEQALKKAFSENTSVLIEEFLVGREFTCGVLCTEGDYRAMEVTEIITEREFFDYEAKYTLDKTQEVTPADLSAELYEKCKSISAKVAQTLDCVGVVRMDYIMVGYEFYLIEVNTIPGMSQASLIPKQAEAMGISKTELIDRIIESAK
ncbi:MAG: D-alanine--D-alanine ligase [Flavobacteriales bacterium]|nr:D-alanine--D-alanine ligase [Flavobacteriales bacterium]